MKKKLILLPALLLMALCSLSACQETGKGSTYYISTTGTMEGKGTKKSPYDVYTAFQKAQKGDTIKVLPGTYNLLERIYLAQSGEEGNYITVENDSETERAIFDFHQMDFLGTNRGITVNGNYWHFNNIEVTGAGDNGMYIGGNYNIVENCQFYDNRDTGLQLGRSGGSLTLIQDWPSYNLIKNCTSYNNYDDQSFGENADGFAAKLTVGYGNVFDGCIAYRNSDDGWDLFAKQDSGNIGTVILYNCVSFENGFLLNKTTEAGVERFITRDGDGIGFKLGGSTMKGDVILNNCVTFNNRLQGVGDNSNPGVISVNNVTAYNNNAAIDENGAIKIDGKNDNESSNFDLARSTDSYNNYSNLLSYATNSSLNPDRFLGSMRNSILFKGEQKYTKIDSATDASSHAGIIGTEYDGMSDDIFKSVTAPNGLNNRDIHKTLRNPDGSVQLGDFLSLKDGELKSSGIGADLTKTSYEEYSHYKMVTLDNTLTSPQQKVLSAYSALEVNCNPDAVFQDMLVPAEISGCKINWVSSNPNVISVGEEVRTSLSNSKEILLTVYRPKEDTEVTLKAEIECENALKVKTFTLKVMKDNPGIGEVRIDGVEHGMMIVDQYASFIEPKLIVTNASSYSGKELSKEYYDLKMSYTYAKSSLDHAYAVDGVYTSIEGVYEVSYEIQSKINADEVKKGSYLVYVTSPNAPVDFAGEVVVSANRDGYSLTASLSNVTGFVYTYASTNATESVETVLSSGNKFEFRNNRIALSYKNPNSSRYYVHSVVTNKAGDFKSEVYSTEIKQEEISTTDALINLLTGGEADTSTIYLLTNDLDFNGINWVGAGKTFKGLLNGNGHKISNVSTNDLALISKLEGTIMNVNFENITLNASWDGQAKAERVGIIGTMSGGYVHNVHITNINSKGSARVGGLVGQIDKGHNYITQISLVNDKDHVISGERTGAIVGFVQDASDITEFTISIENIFVNANIGTGNDYVGGILGRYDNRQEFMVLTISKVYFKGHITAGTYAGGIIGGFSNGNTKISVTNCVSDFSCTYNGTPFTIALKNCSPIIGRFANAISEEIIVVNNNFATFGEYNQFYESTSANFEQNMKNKEVFKSTLKFDLENVWSFNEQTGVISLR